MSLKIVPVLASIIIFLCSIYPAKADLVATTSHGDKMPFAEGPYIRFPSNQTYYACALTLIVDFHAALFGNVNYSMSYSLNGQKNETVALEPHYFGWQRMDESYVTGSAALPALSEGAHNISIYLECIHETWDSAGSHVHLYFDSQTVYFTVVSPVSLLMENKAYNTTEIPLSFHINGTASQIAYNIDNQANMTITGNTTLTGLTEGTHTITVYTNDTSGQLTNFDSATFTVNTPSPSQDPSMSPNPEVLLLILLLALALTATATILYLRKKRTQRAENALRLKLG